MTAIGEFTLMPFVERSMCVKCGGVGQIDRFGVASSYVRDGAGVLQSVWLSGPILEHLVICCGNCGWEWLMQTKDAPPSSGENT